MARFDPVTAAMKFVRRYPKTMERLRESELKDAGQLEPVGDVFRHDDQGELDDVVVRDVEMFRLEYMDTRGVWLCCYKPDGRRVSFWLRSKSKIEAHYEWDD